jgi:hypothetical protein
MAVRNTLLPQLENFRDRYRAAAEGALREEAEAILAEALRLCPVETGALRASGKIDGPTWSGGGDCTVPFSFGGGPVDYALLQHETPPPIYTHEPPTRDKFLEIPLLESQQGLDARLIAGIMRRLR